jgi:hypothetical protein
MAEIKQLGLQETAVEWITRWDKRRMLIYTLNALCYVLLHYNL